MVHLVSQDLSVAGKRAGLAGARSGLFMEQVRLIKEMREADVRRGRTGKFIRPRFMVWENVPGAFSSNKGDDFRAVLEETIRVAEPDAPDVPLPAKGKWPLADCWMGDGWSVAYRVLDAQFWGVPQRRRRTALVADFGGHAAPEILFVRQSVCGDTAESGAEGEEAAARTGSGAGRTSKRGTDYLTGWDNQEKRVFSTQGVTPTLAGSDGGVGRTVCGYIYDARENGIGHTAAGFKAGNGAKANGIGYQEEVAPTLSAVNSGTNQVPAVAVFENHGQDSRITGPLRVFPTVSAKFGTGGNNTPLVMATGQGGAEILENLCPTMNCNHEQPIVTETGCLTPWDIQSRRIAGADGISQTLYSKGKTGGAEGQTVFAGIVRRLTPLECERLQGYPDGWTDIGPWTDSAGKLHKKSSDSARYKALGNSIALPPWSWVLKRLCACYERTATMASLFDGIGGFPLIWERLNGPGSCLWASEIEEFPIAVTRRRFGGKETEP